ncbi:AaceriAGR167Wp [[Ashbya] aceris (nom. inval.)]|nr:AaceriAGR167Wp [[Ashbya] aceris (nom. inval.)]
MTQEDQKPNAKDLRHLLSREALRRRASPIKTTMAYFGEAGMVFLGAGMPPAELFPIRAVSVEVPVPGEDGKTVVGRIPKEAEERDFAQDVPLSRALQYGNSRGQRELVEFLRQHTREFHRLRYADWDVLVTAGSTQAWDASMRLFCNEGDSVVMEAFTYSSSVEAAEAQGLHCVGAEVDSHGIVPERLAELLAEWDTRYPGHARPRVLYTIPTGQNPTGGTLVDARKAQIYRLAQQYDMLIIEDDPYYFLQMDAYDAAGARGPEAYEDVRTALRADHARFTASLARSFLDWDTDGRVVRLESTSKVFAPGCRTGWIVGPRALLDQYWYLQEVSVQSTCGFAQAILSGMLNRWGQHGYTNWLIDLRVEYTVRRDHCLDCCRKYLPDFVQVEPPEAGMFFMLVLDAALHPGFLSDFSSTPQLLEKHLYDTFIKNGVLLACGSWFAVNRTPSKDTSIYFRGTYAAVDPAAMEAGIKCIAQTLRTEFGC